MSNRSFTCPQCHGVVSVPDYSRKVTLEMVTAVHAKSCPMAKGKVAA